MTWGAGCSFTWIRTQNKQGNSCGACPRRWCWYMSVSHHNTSCFPFIRHTRMSFLLDSHVRFCRKESQNLSQNHAHEWSFFGERVTKWPLPCCRTSHHLPCCPVPPGINHLYNHTKNITGWKRHRHVSVLLFICLKFVLHNAECFSRITGWCFILHWSVVFHNLFWWMLTGGPWSSWKKTNNPSQNKLALPMNI